MELYVKEATEDYLEVVDLKYPQYAFVFSGIQVIDNNGKLEVLVNKASVLKSDKAEESNPDKVVADEDEFLSTHTELIINELFRGPLETALG
ncbi:hypothetical protein [Xanthomonas phage BUDD]|nr:hypothetical protein [Xanthomonas phage BUDD]